MDKKTKKRHLDNQGMSVITVLFFISFTGILAASILYLSFLNIRMRLGEQEGLEAFYSAEQVLEEIRAGLAAEMGNAMQASYLYVLERYGVTEGKGSEIRRKQMFTKEYLDRLSGKIAKSASDTAHYSLPYLTSLAKAGGREGNYEIASPKGSVLLRSNAKGLTLAGVQVTFVGKKGRAGVVETDFVLSVPEVSFVQSTTMPKLMDMALLANQSFTVKGVGETVVSGDFYGGRQGIAIAPGADFHISSGNRAVTGGAITLHENSSFRSGEKITLWADNFMLLGENSKASLLGKTFLFDDLTMRGRNSEAVIKGEYYGFGNPEAVARSSPANDEKAKGEKDGKPLIPYADKAMKDKSSAILVNGRSCTLDLTEVKKLLLAGNSYISVPVSQKDPEHADKNILMGESLSVKGGQLAYLVPDEAIGDGKSFHNPMISEEYTKLCAWATKEEGRKLMDIDRPIKKLGGKSLGLMGAAGGRVISYQTADGPTFYFYLEFGDGKAGEKAAASYMQAYYGVADQKSYLEKYLGFYLNNSQVIGSEDSFSRYLTNGNLLFPDKEGSTLQNASNGGDGEEEKEKLILEEAGYVDRFYALNQKMISSYHSLLSQVKHYDDSGNPLSDTHNERAADRLLFDNLIDEKKMKTYIAQYDGRTTGMDGIVCFETKSGYRAYLIDTDNANYKDRYGNGGIFTLTKEWIGDGEAKLVICLGNMKIAPRTIFYGTVICSGTVEAGGGSRLSSDAVNTAKVFQCRFEDGEKEILSANGQCPMDFFWDKEEYILNGVFAGADETKKEGGISLDGLISYENWNKQ